MANYLFVYHGGSMPETQEEGIKAMAEWQAWFESIGQSVVDGGNPVGLSTTVHSDTSITNDGGSNPTSGYSLISASSLEQAQGIAKNCPILKVGGSVEVAEVMVM